MIENIKHFEAELDVEVLRDSTDVIILEDGEIQGRDAGAGQNVAAGIAAKIEALWKRSIERWRLRLSCRSRRRLRIGWLEIAVLVPEVHVWGGGNDKAVSLDVVAGVTGIGERRASGTAEAVGEGEVVAAQRVGRVATGTPRRREGHAVTDGEDGAELPTIGEPAGGAGEGFGGGNVPGAVDDQRAVDVEIGGPASQSHVEPVETGDGIAESVACNSGGTSVDAPPPGKCALHLEAMAHALGQLRFKGIKVGAALIKHSADGTEVGVDSIRRISGIGSANEVPVDVHLGPQISRGSWLGNNQVGFVDTEGLMDPA